MYDTGHGCHSPVLGGRGALRQHRLPAGRPILLTGIKYWLFSLLSAKTSHSMNHAQRLLQGNVLPAAPEESSLRRKGCWQPLNAMTPETPTSLCPTV